MGHQEGLLQLAFNFLRYLGFVVTVTVVTLAVFCYFHSVPRLSGLMPF